MYLRVASVRRGWFVGLSLMAVLLLSGPYVAAEPIMENQAPFRVSFYNAYDDNGTSTGEKDWTVEERDAVLASINAWDELIDNTPGRFIDLHMFWCEFGPNSLLGRSSSPTNGDGTTSWTYAEHIWRDGADYTGPWTGWDVMMEWDITGGGAAWNLGPGDPGPGELDFRSVMAHEIGHSIGFLGTYDNTRGYDDWGNTWGTGTDPYEWAGYNGLSAWDQNLRDQSGNRPISGGTGTPGNFDETGDAYFDGINAVEYYGGPVPIYSPGTYDPDSSLSHLDVPEMVPPALMDPWVEIGEVVRAPNELELAMMRDMGWDIIPEPSILSVLVGGVGLLTHRRTSRRNRQ